MDDTDIQQYTRLTYTDVLQQLADIRSRPLPAPGKRQVKFTPVETLLCYGLFWIVNPHRYGGANIHTAPEALQRLATFFKRSPNSLTSKMLNLDGSRTNGAREEPHLFAYLSLYPSLYYDIYEDILRAARNLALDDATIPDFLDAADIGLSREDYLLGQEDLPASNMTLLADAQADLVAIDHAFALGDILTEKLVERKIRLTQHRFAQQVLTNCNRTCVFCGFAPLHIPGPGSFLRASHIKPWAVSDADERMDIANGLAACPVHDVAFDQGYIAIDQVYAIQRASLLLQSIEQDVGASTYFGAILRSSLLLPTTAKRPAQQYLAYHRASVFKG